MKRIFILITAALLLAAGLAYFWLSKDESPIYATVQIGTEGTELPFAAIGREIYYDKNGDGNFSSDEFAGTSKLDRQIELDSADGKFQYKVSAGLMFGADVISASFPQKLEASVYVTPTVPDSPGYTQFGYVVMSREESEPAVLRAAPEMINSLLLFEPEHLERGRIFDLQVEVEVPQESDDAWMALCIDDEPFRQGTHPELEVKFKETADSEWTVETYQMQEFC